jgi:uncharacterized Zn finger protein
LAEAFDRDPFLVFTWRGRTREDLIERLRPLRGEGTAGQLAADAAEAPLEACLDRFWSAGPQLGEVQIRPWAAAIPDALVRQLGPIGVTVRGRDVVEALAEAYRSMSAAAQRRALGDEPTVRAVPSPGAHAVGGDADVE